MTTLTTEEQTAQTATGTAHEPKANTKAKFDRMNEADRKRVSELKATREQIAAKINDDTQFRAFARRAISLATAVGLFRLRPGDSTR